MPTLIRNADFHPFSSFYLGCLFEFKLRKTIENYVDFVDYLVVWCKSTTNNHRDVSWGSETAKNLMRCGKYGGWGDSYTNVIEVFLHRLLSMGMHIILVEDPPVLQFQAFPVNMPLEELQDFELIFLVDGHLWWHNVLRGMGLGGQRTRLAQPCPHTSTAEPFSPIVHFYSSNAHFPT